jgi:hypothetical protein
MNSLLYANNRRDNRFKRRLIRLFLKYSKSTSGSLAFNNKEWRDISSFVGRRSFTYCYPFTIVRIGPLVTVYWLGGPSASDVLQWDWIFVEARLKQ